MLAYSTITEQQAGMHATRKLAKQVAATLLQSLSKDWKGLDHAHNNGRLWMLANDLV